MIEKTEEVKLVNGETATITILPVGYIARNEVFRTAIKTGMSGQSTSGTFDIFLLQSEAIKRFTKGVNPDLLDYDEGDRIFNKHFARAFNMGDEVGNANPTSNE